MAGYGRKKSGGLTGNLVKMGGAKRKLKLMTDFKDHNAPVASMKKGHKQAHKRA